MAKKPILILIGETHPKIPDNLTTIQKVTDTKELRGMKEAVIMPQGEGARIARIVEKEIEDEIRLLKGNAVQCLFCETPASQENIEMFQRFTPDSTEKAIWRIFKLYMYSFWKTCDTAAKQAITYASSVRGAPWFNEIVEQEGNKMAQQRISAYQRKVVVVPYKAGVARVVPIDHPTIAVAAVALALLNSVVRRLRLETGNTDTATMRAMQAASKIGRHAKQWDARFLRSDAERERYMADTIKATIGEDTERVYAAIVGRLHLEGLTALLKDTCVIRPFDVGEELDAALTEQGDRT